MRSCFILVWPLVVAIFKERCSDENKFWPIKIIKAPKNKKMQKLKSSFNSTRRRLAERAFQAAGIHESSIGEDVRKQLLFLLSNFFVFN
jgi:hypothetical protein